MLFMINLNESDIHKTVQETLSILIMVITLLEKADYRTGFYIICFY